MRPSRPTASGSRHGVNADVAIPGPADSPVWGCTGQRCLSQASGRLVHRRVTPAKRVPKADDRRIVVRRQLGSFIDRLQVAPKLPLELMLGDVSRSWAHVYL